MEVIFYSFLFILGACFGSFLCCQARRLHLRVAKKGTKKTLGSRSVCLHCGRQLKWHDNLPIISWLMLRGKCRHCHQKIGLAEFLSELGTALAFLGIGFAFLQVQCSHGSPTTFGVFPQDLSSSFCTIGATNWLILVMTLIFSLILIFLAIYDGLYGQLPTAALLIAIAAACIILISRTVANLSAAPFSSELLWHPMLAVLILGGLYLILSVVSKGKWVGDGDWLLGTAIAIALGSPWLALIVLFLSNLLACFVMAPLVIKRKQHKIYFGPFMVAAFIITLTFANFFLTML